MSRIRSRALLLVVPLLLLGCAESPTPVAPSAPSIAPSALIVPAYSFGQLSLGNHYSCTVRSDQNLTCWGENYGGQQGSPSNPGTMTRTGPYLSVSASLGNHTCVLRADQSIECFGRNDSGEVVSPASTTTPFFATATYPGPFAQVATGGQHTCALRTDGTVTCWGSSIGLQTTVPPNVTNATQVIAGGTFSCALQASGFTCWGRNDGGQITGTRTTVPPSAATATHSGPFAQITGGMNHVCALRSDDANVVCWGENGYGQVGDPVNPGPLYYSTVIHTGPFVQVGAGANHTCAVRADGTVTCWGWNVFGQINVPAGLSGAVEVRGGGYHSCARKSDNSIQCWGYNGVGQLNVPGVPTTHIGPEATFTFLPSVLPVGQSFTLQLSDAAVPGHPEATSFTYAFDCGSGYGAFGSSNTATCTATALGSLTVHGKVKDQDGDVREYLGGVYVTDPTPPAIAPTVTGTLGANGWYTSDVTVTWSVVDNESAITSAPCAATTIGADTPSQDVTCSATSAGGTDSRTVTLKRDATAPILAPVVSPNPVGVNGSAIATPNESDATSGIASASCPTPNTSILGARTVTCSASDNAGNTVTADAGYSVVPPPDVTPPAITPTITGTLGANGWYTSTVTVSWSVVDNESSITSPSCAPTTIGTDTPGQDVTCSATSGGGSDSKTVTVKRDGTAPALAPVVSPSVVLLNGSGSAAPNASDAMSGLASSSCGAINTTTVGVKSVACTATDNAGNINSVNASYSVVYSFAGFFQPVDNLPTLNVVKGGSAVPLKFGLGGNQGLGIFAAGYPSTQQVSCSSGAPQDVIEETVTAGGSSLSYDAVAQQYVYVWKTEKAWGATCRTLSVKLIDGTTHQASFMFK